MRRIVPLLLSLALLLPPAAGSVHGQVVSVTEGRNHTVTSGETLSVIAQQYYGSAQAWDRIYQANRDRIQDPARIFVGQVLFIPGIEGAARTAEGAPADAAGDAGSSRTPRSLLESRPFQAQPYAVPAGMERTVFYPEPVDEGGTASSVYRGAQRELRTLPPQAVRSAGWILPLDRELVDLGYVDGLVGESRAGMRRTTLLPFEQVRVIPAPGTRIPEVGERVLTVRPTHQVRSLEPVTTLERATGSAAAIGQVIHPTGVLTVRQVFGDGYVAEITGEFDRIQVADRVLPLPDSPVEGDRAAVPATRSLEARMLGLQIRSELPQRGDVLFLDRGRVDGLNIGDEFEAVVQGDTRFEPRVVGRVQVVGVQDETASARILEALAPVFRPGLVFRLSGTMP